MAYTTHDGRHHGVPFLQHQLGGWVDMSMSDSIFEPTDHFSQQHSILTQNDNVLINGFFDDPESALKNTFSFDYHTADQTASGENESAQLNGLQIENQNTHNPAVTIAGNSTSQFQTQSNHSPGHMTSHMNFGAEEQGQGSEDAVRAASGLFNMRRHGQENSHALSIPEGTIPWDTYGSRGAFNNVHMQDNITSPMTSSGRQSANSHHSQPQTTFMNNHFPNDISQEQLMFQWQHNQQQMAQNIPHGRHNSVQMDSNPFNYMQPNVQQMQMTHSAAPYTQVRARPPAPIRFGSDESFRRTGYHGPNSGISLDEEKQGNLINVPLAAQAAANGQSHVQHMPYMTQQLQYSHQPVAGSSRPFQNMSAASSPGRTMGGLPLNSPSFNANRHGQSYRPLPQQHADGDDYEDSDDTPAFQEEQPRKRRKSQREREDDTEYDPSGRMKGTASKRDTKPVIMDDSGDEYQTPAKIISGKRRKSSMAAARPYLGSSNSNSPSADPSPAPKQTPANKKKSRETEPRKNLTEDQKRQNHIASEKHRRDLIKHQYDELDALVPGLKGGKSGLSRSDVLQEIVAYVESIMAGNARMDGLLHQMGEMNVADAPLADGDQVV